MSEPGPAVLVDGRAQTLVPSDDRGLAYGDGLFRTMRVRGGRLEAWPYHAERLAHDCHRLDLPLPDRDALQTDVRRVAAGVTDCVIKILITRGSGGRGYTPPGEPRPRVVISRHALPTPPGPLTLSIADIVLATQPLLAGVKHLNRLEQVWARRACDKRQIADMAMCDADGRLVATTMRNLLFSDREGRWTTPDLSRAGIIGATRQRLMAARADRKAPVVLCDMPLSALHGCHAAIACNSVGGVIPVIEIAGHRFENSLAMVDEANAYLDDTA